MKKLILLLNITFISFHLSAQNPKLESLQQAYSEAEEDTSKILTLIEIAFEYRSTNPDTTLTLARLALKQAEELDFDKGIAWANMRIGNGYMGKTDYLKALDYFQKSLSLFEKIKDNEGLPRCLTNIGSIYNTQGNHTKALEYFQRSLAIVEKIGNSVGIISNLNLIGNIYSSQGNYPRALEYYQRSLAIAERIGNQREISTCLIGIGSIYNTQGNYPKALECFQRSLAINEKIGTDISSSLSFIGLVYYAQGNYPKALDYHNRSLAINEKLGDELGIASDLSNLGDTYLKLGDAAKALDYQQRSQAIAEKIDNLYGITYTLLGMAQAYQLQRNYTLAVEYAVRSLKIAQKLKVLLEISNAQKTLYESYKLMGDDRKALKYLELYTASKDSLFNTEKSKQIAAIETNAELDKKELALQKQELEIQKEKKEKEYQQLINYIVLAGLALVLVLAYFIFRSRQKEKKAKELVSMQKEEVMQQKEEVMMQKEEIQQINEVLEQANEEIQVKSEILEEKNKEITDSITYAQRIQQALLPIPEEMSTLLGEHFVLFRPRDIVSGDFYYCQAIRNKIVLAAVDCTGHGVPGAFMSMLGKEILDNIVIEREITEADQILNELHKGIRKVLKQDQSENRDGMDMSLLVINKETKTAEFSGAKNPLIYIQNGQLFEIKGDKMAIGGEQEESKRVFTKHCIDISLDTALYLFSDGFQDQFGGARGRKFMIAQLKTLLLEIHQEAMTVQKETLTSSLENWMSQGNERQIDDVLLMGVKI